MLYHFMESRFVLDSIGRNRIKLSTVNSLNDPYEMMPDLPDCSGQRPPICHVREKMRDNLKNTGMFCMTATVNSPSLWAHYGDKHKGVAFELLFTEEQMAGLFRVDYSDARVVIREDDLKIQSVREPIFERLIKTKARCWSSEQEYRWVFPLQDSRVMMDKNGLFYRQIPEELKRIILGVDCDIPEAAIRKALHSMGFKDIGITRAKLSESGFDVLVEPLTEGKDEA
jgi:hypothetical protein